MKQEKENLKNKKEQELIHARKSNKEDKRQQLRKGFEKSSRLLDNYYNPKVHQQFWRPNGTVRAKKTYNYGETGLGFNYDNKNVLNKMDNSEKHKITKKQIHYLEFDYMENDDIIIAIEHCSNCEEHQSHTQHINNIYQNISKILQRVILLRFPFIKVYLKPIDTQITNYSKIKSTTIVEDNYKEVRIGAFEIQYAHKINDNVTITCLHSKLSCGLWPSIYNILNKISLLVPIINIKCQLFDKEEGLVDDNNNQVDDLLPTKYQNIRLSLYLLYNEQIDALSQNAMDELDIIYNPKRRQMAMIEQQEQKGIQENESMITTNSNFYGGNINGNSLLRPTTSRASRMTTQSVRPITGKSSHSHSRRNSFNRTVSFQARPMSSSSSHFSTYSKRLNGLETLDDPDMINQLKGKLLSSGYTDNSGGVSFQNVPYDSYLIEVESNKNFLMNGSVVRYHKVLAANKANTPITINKFFGLRRQINSYLEVYIYSNENQNEFDLKLIDDAKVYLIRTYEYDSSLFSPGEDKLLIPENNKIKGRYDIITSPGKIFLEVIKTGYVSIKKEITLRTGENKVNIELTDEN